MAFTFLLIISTLAAYIQAVPTYAGSRLSVSPSLGSRRLVGVGSGLVAPVHDSRFGSHVDSHHGSVGTFNKRYDAGRLVQDIYNPRRLEKPVRLGVVGRLGGSHDSLGHGVQVGHGVHDLSNVHGCNCQLGEVCVEDSLGRPFCQHVSSVNNGPLRGSPSLGFGSRLQLGSQRCMVMEYPSWCERSRSQNSVTRYTFVNGRCQQFVSSRVSPRCRLNSQSNIFRSRSSCERYCNL